MWKGWPVHKNLLSHYLLTNRSLGNRHININKQENSISKDLNKTQAKRSLIQYNVSLKYTIRSESSWDNFQSIKQTRWWLHPFENH